MGLADRVATNAANKKKKSSSAATNARYTRQAPDYAQPGYQGRTYTRPDGAQGNYALEAREYTANYSPSALRAQQQLLNPPAGPGGGGGGGGGYGGGGGTPANVQGWIDSMMKQLASGYFTAKPAQQSPLRGMIDPAVKRDLATANNAYNVLDEYLASQSQAANPYAQMQTAQAATISPELAEFIRSQGGDVAAYGNQVAASNAGAQTMDAQWRNLASALGANVDSSRSNDRSLAQMGRTQASTSIEGQRTALEAAAAQQQLQLEAAQRQDQARLDQERMQLILQILSAARDAGVAMPNIA